MAEKQEKSDLMIQLPWTVPPQPNVQTIVLQQPTKTHMELNASTDKTAISSFALSVVIALILGGLATWLAYWYGRKSFDLTKQSFDAVIAQIHASTLESGNIKDVTIKQIEANNTDSKNNTDTTIQQLKQTAHQHLESNKQLVLSQHKLSLDVSRQAWINSVRKNAGQIISYIDEYARDSKKLSVEAFHTDYLGRAKGMQELESLFSLIKNIRAEFFNLELFLNPTDSFDIEIRHSMNEVLNFIDAAHDKIGQDEFEPNREEVLSSLNVFKSNIQIMLKNEWEKIKVAD